MMQMKYTRQQIISAAFFLVVTFGIFSAGLYFGDNQNKIKKTGIAYSEDAKNIVNGGQEDSFDFNLYFEVWNTLKSNHVDKNQISDKDLFYGSLEGLAAATKDSYTVFMDPDTTQEFYGDLSGTFEGIGAEIGMRNDVITVIAPLDGMPAQKAGLRSGDKIYAINGESAIGLTVNDAVKKIRGPKGTEVTLTIIRGESKPADIKITRDQIFVASIKTEMRKDGIYVIKVSSFNNDTDDLLKKAVAEIVAKQPKGLILDLRNNPGGYLEAAVNMASEWVAEGPVVAEQFGENKREEHFSNGSAKLKNFKTVVLINQGSASASEIVAGALRDYKKATLVGETSFGKGSVQTIKDLSDGSSLKVTVAKWLTPAGDSINDKGIEPEIKIELTENDVNKDLDPQMQKAIELIIPKKK
ncbi:MAG: S41 family peptidase [Patescibacteria group bacterium]|jgi:carboxyl-terminal processing protease